ncbi:MAG TPA: archease [Smithellaceae bacterium]|nr:archease [Smithellaceae bacterium]HRS82279.1 archease [Smithellaceae bacterium]HRV45996.1 archease [Smithellaceae bacterium]
MKTYELFDHTADLGLEIYGRTKKELFANAALALFDMMIQDARPPTKRGGRERVKTRTVQGADVADLLVNFLRELLYWFNGLGWVLNRGSILMCGNKKLVAQCVVEPYNPKRHMVKTEIKAVTYHGLSVQKIKSGWKARVIFDV